VLNETRLSRVAALETRGPALVEEGVKLANRADQQH